MVDGRKQVPSAPGGRLFSMALLILPLLIALSLINGDRKSNVADENLIVLPPISVRPPVDQLAAEDEWLWLARCIYSESKRAEEQRLVAWVVRNRVDTEYRGKDSYKRVVLDPYQFSAFNPGSEDRRFYSRLSLTDSLPGWQKALKIAREVLHADISERPFSPETRHFFSERSMPGAVHPDSGSVEPDWAAHGDPAKLRSVSVDSRRFRFYTGVL